MTRPGFAQTDEEIITGLTKKPPTGKFMRVFFFHHDLETLKDCGSVTDISNVLVFPDVIVLKRPF